MNVLDVTLQQEYIRGNHSSNWMTGNLSDFLMGGRSSMCKADSRRQKDENM